MANFLKARGVYTNKPTTVSSYVGADAAKPAENKPKPKLDAKVLNSYVGKKMAEAAVKMRQPGYNPPKQEHISSAEDQPDGEMIVPILGAKKSLDKIKEAAAAAPPFDKPYKKVVGTVTDKSGAKHSPMSRARDLARKGMKQMMQINPKIAEGWSDAALDQMEEGYIDYTRPSGAAYDATMVKGKMVITPNKPYEPSKYGLPAKKKVTKLPMSQAAGALAAEAVTYTGMGTDVVDKKKKLNPQPNLIMKPKQVKDFKEEIIAEGKMKEIYTDMQDHAARKGYSSHKQFTPADYDELGKKHNISGKDLAVALGHKTVAQVTKEEKLDELKLSTMQRYADKAHQQAMDATYDAAHLNRSGEEKLKADAKRLASKRAGGVQLAQTKMDRKYNAAGDAYRAHTGINSNKQLYNKENLESVNDVNEARVVEQPRAWNVRTLKPAGHGIVGKKVRSYDFPGIHDSHYVEGHVTDEDPQSYHIRTTKVVRHHKEEPIPAHLTHIRAPKGLHIFGNAPGVYYAPREMKPADKKTLKSIRNKP